MDINLPRFPEGCGETYNHKYPTKTTSTAWKAEGRLPRKLEGVGATVTTVGRSWFSKGLRNVVINSTHVRKTPFLSWA